MAWRFYLTVLACAFVGGFGIYLGQFVAQLLLDIFLGDSSCFSPATSLV